jgi:hypothetical protein
MGWMTTAEGGYEVAVEDGKVVCRNAAGKRLRTLPKQVKTDPATLTLFQLTEWLDRHAVECRESAERWMVRSLPVPAVLVREVWADEAWRDVLRDLVIVPVDEDGSWNRDEAGFLRAADERGLGLVNLDGETVRLTAELIAIPHPVLLSELDDLREFGIELGVKQSLDQLYRETWTAPADLDPARRSVSEFSGGRYEQLRHLTQRANKLGFAVRGGYAACRVFEDGRTIEARVWAGSDDPYYETETGNLEYVDEAGKSVALGQVGPVAWSEGHRMAAGLYAGRVVAEAAAS